MESSDLRPASRAVAKVRPTLLRKARYANVADITAIRTSGVSYDFRDDQLLEEKAVLLQEMTPESLSALGRAVIPMMTSGFSPYGVASIFTLAYHLRDPVNPDRFILRPAVIRDDTSLEDHHRTPLSSVSAYSPLPPTQDPVKESQAYSYIAASMLRLFIKPEDHYIKAFNHIVTQYPKFYRQSMNVRLPQPSIEAIGTFTNYIKQGRVFRMTLYRILYIGGGSGEGEELRRFLYETHLENAGLHILSIFTSLCSILDCPEDMLLSALHNKADEGALTALKKMIGIMNDDSDAHRRKMWRYGRIFEESFMSTMRTKSCPILVYTMACMLKELAPDSNRDILNIAQLSVVGAGFRESCPKFAKTIIRHVRRHLMSNSGSASASS